MQEPWHYPFDGQKDGGYYLPDGQKGPAKHPVKMGTLTSPQGSTRQSKACYCQGFTAQRESVANAHTPNDGRRQAQQPGRRTQSQAKISFFAAPYFETPTLAQCFQYFWPLFQYCDSHFRIFTESGRWSKKSKLQKDLFLP